MFDLTYDETTNAINEPSGSVPAVPYIPEPEDAMLAELLPALLEQALREAPSEDWELELMAL